MLAGKHIFAVFLDQNMTLAMREKKDFMPTFGALQAMDEIYLSSNRLVFAFGNLALVNNVTCVMSFKLSVN